MCTSCFILLGAPGPEWGGFASLIVLLVYEAFHNPDSFWAPYLRVLPRTFPGKTLCSGMARKTGEHMWLNLAGAACMNVPVSPCCLRAS